MKNYKKHTYDPDAATGIEVAVIGMSCRFPGANDIDEFWNNLKDGKESIALLTDDELLESGADPEELKHPNFVKAKGVIDNVEYFDAVFFDYTANEATLMDPQVRLFHQGAWEALEHAGYEPEGYRGKIGLYAGAADNFYWQALSMFSGAGAYLDAMSMFQLINKDFLATRVSFKLNLRGPSFSVQTACSTALVAIHLACQALVSGECSMALAGGVTVNIPPKAGYMYAEGMVKSPDGHCRAFDAGALGFAGGDGCGIVVLKALEDALEDGDTIHAVIKGTSLNNDGNRKAGFTAPSIKAQSGVIRGALQVAEVEPETIGYVETHGTATPLGDPIEVEALTRAFNSDKKHFCKIGSVKSNIGHLDAAAGAAGFIKTVLSLTHRAIPPSLHFKNPNPNIDFENSPFEVNTKLTPWDQGESPLRAGVSSFGIGGTNAHIILEEAPAPTVPDPEPDTDVGQLLVMSAKTATALDTVTANLRDYLKQHPGTNIANAAYTLQVGRKAMRHRRIAVCTGVEDAVQLLDNSTDLPTHARTEDKNRVVFLFAGLGNQYIGMGRDLYKAEPLFREEIDKCDEILKSLKPAGSPGIKELLYGTGKDGDLRDIRSAQETVFAVEYALAQLIMSWGIRPDAMIGYSFGEYTAACIAGVFSLEDALKVIVKRGELLSNAPEGAMFSVPLDAAGTQKILASHPELSIAIDNGSSCIVAGPGAAISALEKTLKAQKLMGMQVPHSVALHSPVMAPLAPGIEQVLKTVTLSAPEIPFISNLTGTWTTAEEVVEPSYWSRHMQETVRFADGINELIKYPHSIFIEIGPGRDLSTMIKRFLDQQGARKVINLLRTPQKEISDSRYLLGMVGRLWLYGIDIDWAAFNGGETFRRIPLPTYPFEGRRFWFDTRLYQVARQVSTGQPLTVPTSPDSLEPGIVEENRGDRPGLFSTETPTDTAPVPRSELSSSYEEPGSPLEKTLANIWERFFGMAPIGAADDFFELGGDSLKAMNVSNMIREELQSEVPIKEFFDMRDIRKLAAYIEEKGEAGDSVPMEPVETREFYPVSSGQRRLYVLQQMGEGHTTYNEPVIVALEGTLDREKLERAFWSVIKRHESFRSSFSIIGGETVLKVHSPRDIKFDVEYLDIEDYLTKPEYKDKDRKTAIQEVVINYIRPFQLDRAPLMRVGVLKTAESQYVLIVDLHHLITDGTSHYLLVEDFMAFYRGMELPELPYQYNHYAQWQSRLFQSPLIKKQEDFWLNEFAPGIPELDLPTDFPRPKLLDFSGNRVMLDVDKPRTLALKKLAADNEATMFMVLLACLNTLLLKVTGQEDIVCGSLIAGRSRAELQRIVGMFVNTQALRTFPEPGKTFSQYLAETREKTLLGYENQDYQFETLVEKVVKNRDTSRNPLFDVLLVLQNMPGLQGDDSLTDLVVKPFEFENKTAKFDLRLEAVEVDDTLSIAFEYRTSIFREDTIRRFTQYFTAIIDAVLDSPHIPLGEIDVMTEAEKEKIVFQYNDTRAPYPEDKTLITLFEERAQHAPDSPAVARADGGIAGYEKDFLTYTELDGAVNRLAAYLRENGVRPGTVAGLMMNRSVEALTVILSILRAGGAYVPIDPEYPAERVKYMLTDSGASVLVSRASAQPGNETQDDGNNNANPGKKSGENTLHDGWNGNVIDWDDSAAPVLYDFSQTAPVLSQKAEPVDAAYIIYTSGSTGKPKGAVLEHRNVVNYITWAIKQYVKDQIANFPLFTSLSFDLTVTSIYTPLLSGGSVVVYEGDGKEPLIDKIIDQNRVDVVKLTPAHLKLLLELGKETLDTRVKRLIVGGEALETRVAEKIAKRFVNGVAIHNEYGPTEAAVGCMIYSYNPGTDTRPTVPVGVPADNAGIYLLDKNLEPVPVGVAGEMFISGSGVARGYVNRPELTAGKFIENPFVEGERMYRTGDLARFLSYDNIEFLGRMDHQVKIRGFRIELEEIQEQLMGYRKNKPFGELPADLARGWPDGVTMCNTCLMPSNFPGIQFDEHGVCNTCREYEEYKDDIAGYFKTPEVFEEQVKTARENNTGEYDCLLLFSGGKDSTYVLYKLIDMGLKVLTFTFDNGYISDAAFANINRTTSALNVKNIVCKTKDMNKVFVESLNTTSDVCRGCWNALNTYGAKVARENGIDMVISGLSRGQIFEMRLEGLFNEGIFDENEIEEHLKLFRKSFHSQHNRFLRLLGTQLDEEVVDRMQFIDFFRYFDVPTKDIRQYLDDKGWVQPGDTGFCSSNCLINDVGIFVHLQKENYHFYAAQTSWDIRTGCIPREEGLKEMEFVGDHGHVENVLQEIGYYRPPIKDAVVIDREGNDGEAKLAAYIVSDDDLMVPELREYLTGRLPDYMVPSDFIRVDAVPLTTNGKVDRKALRALGKKLDMGVEHVAPGSDKERLIAGAWKEVLKLEDVGIHDNFFDLGGTSVDIIRVNSKFRDEFNVDIPIVTMYQYTTIAALANYWNQGGEKDGVALSQRVARKENLQKGKTMKQKRRELRSRRKK